jgi:hypothetical protein
MQLKSDFKVSLPIKLAAIAQATMLTSEVSYET